jgi:primosomal protein DnaI
MERIDQSLKAITGGKKFQQQFQQLKEKVLRDERVQSFYNEQDIPEQVTNRGMSKLYEFMEQWGNCDHCPGLEKCPNMMKGFQPHLFLNQQSIDLKYERCSLKAQDEEKKKQKTLFQSMYIPKEVLDARFEDIEIDKDRFEAIRLAENFVEQFVPGETKQGLYFYGDFGVGKTYMMCAIANELAKQKQVQSMIVYTPDFFREMKSSISDQSIDQKLDYIKKVPLLILDDIGAENMSSWIRDDILGGILQYRMMENLVTLYSSNYDYDELENHLAYSQKGGIEQLKAKRIMERIRHYTMPVYIGGTNRRTL